MALVSRVIAGGAALVPAIALVAEVAWVGLAVNFHVVDSSFSPGIVEAPFAFAVVKALPAFVLADRCGGPSSRTRTFRTRSHIVHFACSFEVAPAGRRQAKGALRALSVVRPSSFRFRAVRVSAYRSILRRIHSRGSVLVVASATRLVRGSS